MQRKSIPMLLFACLLLRLGCLAASDTTKNAAPSVAAHPELVVSTQWLADHLSEENLIIVHIGHDEGEYRAAHIPGARFLAMDKFVDHHTPPEVELLPPDQLKKNLQGVGINDNSRVVYYSPDWDPVAARFFFTMDYLGHGNHSSLLDGGLEEWTRERRPISKEVPQITPGTLTVHLHPEILAKMDYMKQLTGHPAQNVVIIDARPPKRYRSGHLRGAESFYWENALVSEKEPLLKSPEQIRLLFTKAGVTDDKKEVSYCEVGLQASYTYFLARYLGIAATMYDGSYNEWSEAKQPVVRGDSPQ